MLRIYQIHTTTHCDLHQIHPLNDVAEHIHSQLYQYLPTLENEITD